MNKFADNYPLYAQVIHLGLAIFGIAAFLTGELAEEGHNSTGFLLHAYLGLSLTTFILLRVASGLLGPAPLSFSGWSPVSRQQCSFAMQDLRCLLQLRIPERKSHQGLAGLVQAFGLFIFSWMSATGTGLFLLRGGPEGTLFELLEELHEVGETLIPLYLALHVGAVIVHTLAGRSIWKKMFSFKHM